MKVMRDAAKLAQWRAPEPDKAAIKEARKAKRIESVAGLVRKYVSEEDMRKLRKRGCLHSVDFPEKRDRAARAGEEV
jgi:hypothetical protein